MVEVEDNNRNYQSLFCITYIVRVIVFIIGRASGSSLGGMEAGTRHARRRLNVQAVTDRWRSSNREPHYRLPFIHIYVYIEQKFIVCSYKMSGSR